MNRTLKALCATEKDFKDEELHKEKNRLLEKTMDVFLNLDMKELKFNDYHDFLKFDQTKYSMITHMAYEIHPENILRTYIQDLSGDNAEEFCKLTMEDVKEVLIRKDFIQNYNIFYNIMIPFLTTETAKKIDVFELLEEGQDEALEEVGKYAEEGTITNTEMGELTMLIAGNHVAKYEDKVRPGADISAAYQAYRKKNWDKPVYNPK